METIMTMNASTALESALGLDPSTEIVTIPQKPLIEPPIESDDQISTDAQYARKNIIDIIQRGQESLINAMSLAYESQHPRAFEILGQILKVQSDNVDKLMKLHAQVKE